MDDLPNIAQYGWGGAFALVVALLFWLFRRREKREDEARKTAAEHREAYAAALRDWEAAIEAGDAAAAAAHAEELERMRKWGWNALPLVVAGLCLAAGCRAPRAVSAPVSPVLLTEHVRIVKPGDTVPELPAGESRWWLCTPTGMRRLLPSDAPVNGGAEK